MTFPDGLTRLLRATAFSFLSILAIQNAALAQAPATDPWDGTPLTADPRAVLDAAQKVPTDDAAVVVLLDEDRYSFDSQGRATTARHLVYRIVNESAVDEWSTVQALWAPWYQEKPQIQARVITKDGEVRVLDPKAISDAPAPEESLDIFSDNRTLRAPLPAIAPGSIVEELLTYQGTSQMAEAGTSGRFAFGRHVPVHQSRLVLDAPSGVTLRIVNRTSPEIQPAKSDKDGRQTLTFESGPLKAIDHFEWNLPYDVSSRPYVAFSTGKSWQEIAKRYSTIVDQQIGDGNAVRPLVREALGNTKDRKEIIARLLAAIEKDVRYAGVEIGESSIVPRPPQEVLGHKYGDCKDKATLLVSMLRAAGISAHVALLRAGDDLDVDADLPGMGQFNHAIVIVDGEPSMWVDPTDDFARAGEVPVPDQGRLALIANPSTKELAQVPISSSADNRTIETRVFDLAEEGKAAVTETTESTGAVESSQRRFFAQSDRKQFRDALENYAKNAYNAKALKNLEASDPHDLSKPFKLSIEITEAGRGSTEDGEAAVAIFPTGLLADLPFPLQVQGDDDDQSESGKAAAARRKRVHDFVFVMPYMKEWKYRIVPPPGYVARPLPQNETTRVGSATMTKEFSTDKDGAVLATFRFDSGKRRLSASEVEDMRKAVKDLRDAKTILIGFDEVGQTRLGEGDVKGALAEFNKLAALHPKEARHHVEIARALLVGGMGDAARTEARRAIEIEPTYARGYETLGIIMENDLLGRPFRKGFDLEAAVAALRKARELDPKSVEIRANLAQALEYGSDGILFSKGNRLPEAIDELKSIETDLKDDHFEGDVLLGLAHAGRFEEMRDVAKNAKDVERRDMGRAVAIAALEGSQAALRDAASLDQGQRRKILEAAGGLLVALRLYPQAADLLEASAQGTSKMTELRDQIELLRKAKRIEDITMPENDPKTAVRRLLVDAMETSDRNQLASHFASDEHDILTSVAKNADAADADDEDEDHTASTIRLIAAKQQMPLAFYADLGVSGMELLQEGDDKTGYRIRTRNAGQGGLQDETFYVIREGNGYRVSATNRVPGLMGLSVLRFVQKGDAETARQWLNWVRDETNAGNADDPLGGPSFAKLWPKNKATATADEERVAAASLMLNRNLSDRAVPILVKARDTATDEMKPYIDSALAISYVTREDWPLAAQSGQRLVAAFPDSMFAFDMETMALTGQGKRSDVQKLSDERLKRLPKDREAFRALARAAMRDGDYASCEKFYRQIIDQLEPTPEDYNNVAWNALFVGGGSLNKALEDARRAISIRSNPSSMHTLAALYAETGKSTEARDTLLQSMDEAGRDEPAAHDWYVLGRIAENYGATDAALAAYQRVSKPKDSMNDSTYLLAQRRLQAIGKK